LERQSILEIIEYNYLIIKQYFEITLLLSPVLMSKFK